jgi:LAO/AO transport system kinase
MPRLATSDDAYVRPSPAGRTLGGVARRTRETLTLCEAAGYDHVLVETVGVGQSETAVAEMVDTFVLLAAPGGGDDLQGIKRGIVELADLVVVTKADGGLLPDARRAAADHRAAVGLLRPALAGWKPPVLLTSAVEGEGITEVAEAVEAHRDALQDAGALGDLRAGQATAWLWREVGDRLLDALRRHPGARQEVTELEDEVATGALPPSVAADRLLAAFLERDG